MNLLVATTKFTDIYQIIYCRYSNPEQTGRKSAWCEMLNSVRYPLKTHENKHNSNRSRTVQINRSITIEWSLSSCNVCTQHDNVWTWRTLPKPFIVETVQFRIGLSQHWRASSNNSIPTALINTCIEFMKLSNSTGPLTWSLSEYRNLEQSKAVRQKKSTFL